MKFKFTVNLGSTSITFEDEAGTHVEFIEKAAFYMDLPKTCEMCGGIDLVVQHRVVQDFDFYSVRCKSCDGELKFGQTKEGRRLFPKGWSRYTGTEEVAEQPVTEQLEQFEVQETEEQAIPVRPKPQPTVKSQLEAAVASAPKPAPSVQNLANKVVAARTSNRLPNLRK